MDIIEDTDCKKKQIARFGFMDKVTSNKVAFILD